MTIKLRSKGVISFVRSTEECVWPPLRSQVEELEDEIVRCRAAVLFPYDGSNLFRDWVAGLCAAAVALPVGVAYTQLAGFNPAVGLYSSILPLVAYAIFGTRGN